MCLVDKVLELCLSVSHGFPSCLITEWVGGTRTRLSASHPAYLLDFPSCVPVELDSLGVASSTRLFDQVQVIHVHERPNMMGRDALCKLALALGARPECLCLFHPFTSSPLLVLHLQA